MLTGLTLADVGVLGGFIYIVGGISKVNVASREMLMTRYFLNSVIL